MADLVLVAIGLVLMMSALVSITVLWTVAVKLAHPKWSWRRCAKYTTLIQ